MAKSSFVASPAVIKVIGVGGGGCNAVTRMVRAGIRGAEFYVLNTDAQALALAEAPYRIQIGEKLTRGLGAGGDHNQGRKAAEESQSEIKEIVTGADMVFITGGMGGGTGTGSAPVVAEITKQAGALTIAVVTKPFSFEGAHRGRVAEEGIENLLSKVDTLIMVPNDRLLTLCDHRTPVDNAFKRADDVLCHGVQAITEVINVPGLINLDFADIRTIMKNSGPAWMSVGTGRGQNRAVDAAKEALASPLLDVSLDHSSGALFNMVGGESLSLFEVNEAAAVIKQALDPDANIIFGVAYDSALKEDVRITLIATGFQSAVGSRRGAFEDDEANKALKKLRDDDLDIPSFMRRPLFNQRRRLGTTSPQVTREAAHDSIPTL